MGHPVRRRRRPAGVDARPDHAAAPVSPGPMPACRARCPAPSLRPPRESARGPCQPDPIAAPARAAVTPAARGRLTAGEPCGGGHHDSRAAPVVTARHREKPRTARSASMAGSPGRAGHAPPARVFAPAALAGRAGKVPAAGQPPAARFTPSARSVTGWPQALVAAADPLAMAGAASTTKRSRWRRAR